MQSVLEESSKRRLSTAQEAPMAHGTASMRFTMQQVLRLRRYFMEDWLYCVKKGTNGAYSARASGREIVIIVMPSAASAKAPVCTHM